MRYLLNAAKEKLILFEMLFGLILGERGGTDGRK